MSFLLFPNIVQLAFATMFIGGGGVAIVKTIQGQTTELKPVTSSTHQASSPAKTTEKQTQGPQKILERRIPAKAENCRITKRLKNIPTSFWTETKDYLSVSCEDKTSDSFPYNWQGLFPGTIFKSGEKLSEGQELIIKIEDTEESSHNSTNKTQEYWSKITISSPQFSTPDMTAEWKYVEGNDSWAEIKVTQPPFEQKIYLLLNEDEQKQAGNCEIIDTLKHVPESFKGSLDSYFSVFCDVSGVDTFPDPLWGLFPKDFFKDQSQLTLGKGLNIKIETDMGEGTSSDLAKQVSEEEFGITFSSEYFSESPKSGKWSYETQGPGTIVKLSDSGQVYLLLSDTDEKEEVA